MPEPFKALFNPSMIAMMGGHLAASWPGFDRDGFVAMAVAGIDGRELKARSAAITLALDRYMPADFAMACAVMLAALHPDADAPVGTLGTDARGIRGWAVMPMADYVAARGLGDYDRGMQALGEMTKRFTAEFAVRAFLVHDPVRGMDCMRTWARDSNVHLRRLASEGSLPRLPWGRRLQVFVAEPAPVLEVLAMLRDDPEEYVRRSVANSLNDIAKDHPDRIAELAAAWLRDASPARRRLVRRACRTLVKAGHPRALAALGHGPAEVALAALELSTPIVDFGRALEFAVALVSQGAEAQTIVLDYVIHHRKARGRTSPKVFKWKTLTIAPGARVTLVRRHPMRPITTRVYHDGPHRLEIVANGTLLGGAPFELRGTPQRVGTGVSPR